VPSEKTTASCKGWAEPNALGFHDLESWKGRVLGSRKVDAPMLTLLRHMSQFPLTRHLLRVIRRVTCSKGLFTAHELNRNKPHFANSRENSHTGELVER